MLFKENNQIVAVDPILGDFKAFGVNFKKFPFTNEYTSSDFP